MKLIQIAGAKSIHNLATKRFHRRGASIPRNIPMATPTQGHHNRAQDDQPNCGHFISHMKT